MKQLKDLNLRALNSATKYPSIPTYHRIGDRGRLQEDVLTPFPRSPSIEYEITEKIDGTNTRIVLLPATDEYLIGSREEWLTYSGDLVANPSQGIVEALGALPKRLLRDAHSAHESHYLELDDVFVIYGEVYGGKINTAKNYTSSGKYGFRVFDMWKAHRENVEQLTSKDVDVVAKWRDAGGQPFFGSVNLESFTRIFGLESVPYLDSVPSVPTSLRETFEWMSSVATTKTHAGIDSVGMPEGIVIRTPDRKTIAKLRFEDYQRSLR